MQKRITMELQSYQQNPLDGIQIFASNQNMTIWTIFMDGPSGSAYEGGKFQLECLIPEQYPFQVILNNQLFISPIYHPNVDKEGQICQDIYKNDWLPTKNISKIIILLKSMLINPNLDSPLIQEIAELYRNNYKQFYKNCQEFIKKHQI